MIHDLRSIQISKDKSILDAMKSITESGSRFGLVVDEEQRLIGVVTDGDIRRGFIKGYNSDQPVKDIMNTSPVVVREGLDNETMLKLIDDKIAQVPVLDGEGRVKGVITFRDRSILMDVKSRRVCILGLGYVGLTLSFALAEVGFKIFGYDISNKVIEKINNNLCPFHENGMQTYLNRHIGKNLVTTNSISECQADTYIITVGTPVDSQTKIPKIEYVRQAAKQVAECLKPGDLVMLRSTVTVGTTRKIVAPILEEISGLKTGRDYYLAYAPERTVAGNAISELWKLPQVIGGYDEKSAMMADRFFKEITSIVVDAGSLEGSEMVKILNNTFRDVKFAYANELALICEEMGLDMIKLVQAANYGYVRDEIPMPSPGVGGACLTKDPYILIDSCKELKFKPRIVELSREINEFLPFHIVEEVDNKIKKQNKKIEDLKIFVIGFAFKGEPETCDVRGSTTIDVINHFRNKSYINESFYGYDPVVSKSKIISLGVKPVSIDEGFKDADIVMIMNNHKSYKKLDIFNLLRSANKRCIFVDGWRTFEPDDIKTINNINHIGIGSL